MFTLSKGDTMTKTELIKRLEGLIEQMRQERSFGQVTIAFRDGEPDLIRKETTEKIGAQGNSHAKTSYR
jgi:hypothetical protein